jgi:hypothetical protein
VWSAEQKREVPDAAPPRASKLALEMLRVDVGGPMPGAYCKVESLLM